MKFLILALAAGLLYLLFKGDQKKKQMDSKDDTEKLKETGELVKDPMCGTYCRADSEIRVREGDQVHVFCSYECRDKFLKQMNYQPPSQDSDQNTDQDADEEPEQAAENES